MNLRFIRLGFVIIGAILGVQFGGHHPQMSWWARACIGAVAGFALVGFESLIHRIGRVSVRGFSPESGSQR